MILVNGRVASKLAASDRGLHYGDGLFETIAVFAGKPELYELHLKRLESGCRRLAIEVPSRESLDEEVTQLCRHLSCGVLKIVITRGSGGRGYRPPSPRPPPTRILSVHPWPDYPHYFATEGITLRLCCTPLGDNPALAGMKHLNRLEQVLAQNEWADPAIPEGLMLDTQGQVIEGTMSNLFIVREGGLQTPDLSRCGVAGVMREFILEQAGALGARVTIQPLMLADLKEAEELFVCNSIIGLWPVRRLEQYAYPMGPLTQRLRRLLAAKIFSFRKER
jgi:4-amino-4-deoxychorismate lyase